MRACALERAGQEPARIKSHSIWTCQILNLHACHSITRLPPPLQSLSQSNLLYRISPSRNDGSVMLGAGARLADGLQHRRHKMGGHRPAFVNELGCEDQAAAPKASVQAGLRKMLVEEAEWGSRKPGFRGPAHTCQIQTACSRQAGQLGHRMLGQQRGRRLVDEAGVIGSCFSMTSH